MECGGLLQELRSAKKQSFTMMSKQIFFHFHFQIVLRGTSSDNWTLLNRGPWVVWVCWGGCYGLGFFVQLYGVGFAVGRERELKGTSP